MCPQTLCFRDQLLHFGLLLPFQNCLDMPPVMILIIMKAFHYVIITCTYVSNLRYDCENVSYRLCISFICVYVCKCINACVLLCVICIVCLSVYKLIYTRNHSHCLQDRPVKTNLIGSQPISSLVKTNLIGSQPLTIRSAGVRMTHWEDDGELSYCEKLLQVFSKIDKDRDGIITCDKLRQYCEGDQLDDAIKVLGINQDGSISFEEFYERFKKVTPMLDSVTPQPVSSTEAGEEERLEWESIMRKFSIDT